MDIAFSRHVCHVVVVLECDTLGLKRPHDIFDILTDHSRHGCGLVGSGVLRLIDVDHRVSTPENYQFLVFNTDLRKAERVFILKII
jgi:hypothetical protein